MEVKKAATPKLEVQQVDGQPAQTFLSKVAIFIIIRTDELFLWLGCMSYLWNKSQRVCTDLQRSDSSRCVCCFGLAAPAGRENLQSARFRLKYTLV